MTFPVLAAVLAQEAVKSVLGWGKKEPVSQDPDPQIYISEQGREEELLGNDPPVRYDNRASTLEQHYTLTASREWRREVKVDQERVESDQSRSSAGLSLPAHFSFKVESAITRSLKETYSSTEGKVEKFEQSIALAVPPRTLVLVTLQWKRIWQIGEIQIKTDQGSATLPFRSLAGVAFDVHTESRPATD